MPSGLLYKPVSGVAPPDADRAEICSRMPTGKKWGKHGRVYELRYVRGKWQCVPAITEEQAQELTNEKLKKKVLKELAAEARWAIKPSRARRDKGAPKLSRAPRKVNCAKPPKTRKACHKHAAECDFIWGTTYGGAPVCHACGDYK